MELENAVNQAHKELSQRYDFKGVDASLKQTGETIVMEANTEERVKAVRYVINVQGEPMPVWPDKSQFEPRA